MKLGRVTRAAILAVASLLSVMAAAQSGGQSVVTRHRLEVVEDVGIEQRFRHVIDRMLLIATVGVTALQIGHYRRELQMDQLVDDRELHVLEHFALGHVIVSRVEHANHSGLFG